MKKTFSLRLAWYGLIAMVALLPMVVLLPWIVYKSYSTMLESSFLKEELYVDQIKGKVYSETTRLITMLVNKSDPISHNIGSDRDINLLLQLLEAILSREKAIRAVFIINTKAGLIAGMDRDSGNELLKKIFLPPGGTYDNEFDPESPKVVIPSFGRNYIGSPLMHEGKLTFDIAVPIGRRKSPVGVLIASVYVEELWKETVLQLARPEINSYILDRRGSILSTPPPSSGYKQGDILTQIHIVRSLIVSERHIHSEPYEGLMGIPVFGVGAQIEILNWVVISEIPVRMITTPIYRFLLVIIVLGVLLVILFGWLGLLISRRMLNPISGLSLAFERARYGDYSAGVPTSSIREFNMLAEGFNNMIDNINEREKALKESEASLAEAQRLAQLGNWELDLVKNNFSCSEEVYRIFELNSKKFGASYEVFVGAIHPEERDFVSKAYADSVKNKTPYDIVYRLLMKDDRVRYVNEICETFYDADGNPIRSVGTVQDITERKKAEETIRDIATGVSAQTGETFFQSAVLHLTKLFDAGYAFIGLLDERMPGTVNTFALCVRGEIVDNMTYDLANSPCKHVVEGACHIASVYPCDVQQLFPEDRMLVEMGAESYVGAPLLDMTGKPIGLIVVMDNKPMENTEQVKNILEIFAARAGAEMERMRADKELLESEERLRRLVDATFEGIVIAIKGKIQDVNQTFADMFGYSHAELIGISAMELTAPESHDTVLTNITMGYEKSYEALGIRKDGSKFPFEAQGKSITYKGKNARVTAIRDISGRKQAEEDLRESNEILERFFETTHFQVAMLDSKCNFIRVNDSYANVCGFEPDYFIGKNLFDLYPSEELESKFRRVVETGASYTVYSRPFEFPNQPERGTTYWDLAVNPVKNPFGKVEGLLFTLLEVTRRVRAGQELAKYQEHLEELVEERTAELAAVNKELEAFSYSVSHDLRAPLRSIDGFSQALLDDYDRKLDEGGKHMLQRLRANSQNMAELIDDMLDLSRLTRKEMHRQEVDLSALVRDITKELRDTDRDRRVDFAITDNAIVNGDPILLKAMMENLLGNAWKFTGKRKDALIEFGVTQQDGNTTYFVRDNGAGLDMAYADKLFGAFQRLHSESEFSGTGIGLATVQRIIYRHGGKVWAEAEVNKGATFYFTL